MDDKFNFNDDDDDSGGNEWLATYGDLVTLLLCFFVLLYSMSTIDVQKFKTLVHSMQKIGLVSEKGSIMPSTGDSIANMDSIIDKKQDESIYSQIEEVIKEKGLQKEVIVSNEKEGVLLRFNDEILFDSGKAVLKPTVKALMRQIGQILGQHNAHVKVEGHTDNVPIKNSKYADNWELSVARAMSVLKFFTQEVPVNEQLNPGNFEVSGYGEFHPVAPNNSLENKSKNRRIEILIKNDVSIIKN
jgi:chemotaxis protein MotB